MRIVNQKAFAAELKTKFDLDDKKVEIILETLKDTSPVGRKSKDKIVDNLMEKLSIDKHKANDIYNASMEHYMSNILK